MKRSDADKIVLVVEKMMKEVSSIKKVVRSGSEYYFEYPEGVYWSISKWNEQEDPMVYHSLFLYPKYQGKIERLVNEDFSPSGVPFISYSSKSIVKLFDLLPDLYEQIKSRYFGVDDVFDRILGSD